MSKSGFSWNDKKSKFSLIVEQRFRNTSSKPIMTEEVSKNWMELSSLNEVRLIVLWQETNNFDEINNFFMNNYWSKIENFLKLMWSLNEMEELKWFQGSTFDEFSRRRLIENQDTILALTARIQELQNEVTCDDSRDFKDAESVRSGQSHVTSQPAFFPPFRDPYGMLSRSLGMPSRNEGQPSIWDTQGISGNVFANPTASSSAPYPQESNPWVSNVSEHTSPHVMSESQTPSLDPRCQSGPSARNSFVPCEADQQRLQISDPHFDKFPTSETFACWKIWFKTEVCTCSHFPSIRGIRTPDFEVLDAKIASALNRIIHNTRFKKKVSLEEHQAQKEDHFLRGRQIAYLIYEYFRVTGATDSVENYVTLFTIVLRNDGFSGIPFEMGRNSIINDENPIWWHLGRIVQN